MSCASVAPVARPRKGSRDRGSVHRRLTWIAALSAAGFGFAPDCAGADEAAPASMPRRGPSFDARLLRSRGIDPHIAEYLSVAPRFRPGKQRVMLIVNGRKAGPVDVTIDANGELCWTAALLEHASLDVRGDVLASADGPECVPFVKEWPQTRVVLAPNRNEIALIVPTAALRVPSAPAAAAAAGGVGGVMNYDVVSMTSHTGSRTSRHLYATTEAGFNADDWIVRSRQMYVSADGSSRFEHLYAYAQWTLPERRSTIQAGQINIASPLFTGAPISGVQITPEAALTVSGGGPTVEGVAQSDARVIVRQGGSVIHATQIPAGPFTLTGLPILNARTDLEVTVAEIDGSEYRFVVPAASLAGATSTPTGYSLAVGRLRHPDAAGARTPWVATAAGNWARGRHTTVTAGVMTAADYHAAGWGIDIRPWTATIASVRHTVSSSPRARARGSQAVMSVHAALPSRINAGLSATVSTPGYRSLLDSATADASTPRYQNQYSASLGWSHPAVGGLNVSYTLSKSSRHRAARLVGSWTKTFRRAALSARIETTTGGTRDAGAGRRTVYVSVGIPLDSRSVRSSVTYRDDRAVANTSFAHRVNEYANYRIAIERGRHGVDASGNLAVTPRYAQLGVGATRYGRRGSSYSAQLRGGIALHGGGITASPYPIQDTFGIASAGNIGGVRLQTSSGPVWTDAFGQAVIPSLPPYRRSRVELDTRTLPRNVDIGNGVRTIEAGRGSVNRVTFDVVRTRRVWLEAATEDGRPLPKGASATTEDGTFVTTVVGGGQIFLTDAVPHQTLIVRTSDDSTCTLTVELPDKADDDAFYERARAVCRG